MLMLLPHLLVRNRLFSSQTQNEIPNLFLVSSVLKDKTNSEMREKYGI